ncbi:MAG: hypothetical protein RTU30_14855 [Candidatus Thorarchaeota archaeon]
MPKKKKGRPIGKILLVFVIIGVVSIGVIAWHDGLVGITSMGEINNLNISGGTSVRLKGEITSIGSMLTASDGTGAVSFTWSGPVTLNWVVVITGVVGSAHVMQSVSAVDPVWIFG